MVTGPFLPLRTPVVPSLRLGPTLSACLRVECVWHLIVAIEFISRPTAETRALPDHLRSSLLPPPPCFWCCYSIKHMLEGNQDKTPDGVIFRVDAAICFIYAVETIKVQLQRWSKPSETPLSPFNCVRTAYWMLYQRRNHSCLCTLRTAPLEATTYLKGQHHPSLSGLHTEPSGRPVLEAPHVNSSTPVAAFLRTPHISCQSLIKVWIFGQILFLAPCPEALQRNSPPAHSHS